MEERNRGGRPRKWDQERTVRVLTKFDRSAVNTMDVLVEYLKAHSDTPTKIDRSSLVHTAVMEYLRRNATLVQIAVKWYRQRRKRKGGARLGEETQDRRE